MPYGVITLCQLWFTLESLSKSLLANRCCPMRFPENQSPCEKMVVHSQWLSHWGRVTHICVSKLTIIGPENGLSPEWCQAIIWTNAGILLIAPLRTNFSKILIKIFYMFSFNKMHLKTSSEKWQPFCPGLNELRHRTVSVMPTQALSKHGGTVLGVRFPC